MLYGFLKQISREIIGIWGGAPIGKQNIFSNMASIKL